MAEVLQFPPTKAQEIQARLAKTLYSASEVSQLCGLSERLIRRWTREGLVNCSKAGPNSGDAQYDVLALQQFRRARALRSSGRSLTHIEQALCGQLNLFPESSGEAPGGSGAFERARILFESGDPEARTFFEESIRAGALVAESYCNLGVMAFERGEHSSALGLFTKALVADPRHFESHYNFANVHFDLDNKALAREHYQIASTIEPRFANTFFNLGLVLALLGDLSGAIASMQRFQEICESQGDASQAEQLLTNLKTAQMLFSGARG